MRPPSDQRAGLRRAVIAILSIVASVAVVVVMLPNQARLENPVVDAATRDALQRFVAKAAAYAREHGRAAALDAFTQPGGAFHQGEFYIYAYDFSGTVLAHGGDPSLVGKNLLGQVDANGVEVIRGLIELARSGSGSLDYTWPNPAHGNALEPKLGYVQRVNDEWFIGSGVYGTPAKLVPVRVQLKWYHQAQFAGFYVAQEQGFFDRRGIRVNAVPADFPQDANPIASIEHGTADVAVASMAQAVEASRGGHRYVNVAQILQEPDSLLICRFGPGRIAAQDLRGATIASSPDREPVIRELMARIFPGGGGITYVRQLPDLGSLLDAQADCIWGSTFNEAFQASDQGLPVFLVAPEDYGVTDFEDGIYVDEERLADPAFRQALVGLTLGLQEGWAFARANPDAAVQTVLAQPGTRHPVLGEHASAAAIASGLAVDASHQKRQLQGVLALIGDRHFGFFDAGSHETLDALGAPRLPAALADRLWTHDIWNAAQKALGTGSSIISPVTSHYIVLLRSSFWYRLTLEIGVFAAAITGAIIAVRRRYRIWGMYVTAAVTALGGGIVRDILLGGIRFPIWLLHDQTDLVVVGFATVLVWAIANLESEEILRADRWANYADIVGFSIIAVNGGLVALIAGADPVWAPLCAAISTAGGGILSDVLVNREHVSYTGEIYDEGAVVGALVLLGGLVVANANEHRPWLVLAAFLVSLGGLLLFRYLVLRLGIRYPRLGFPFRRGSDGELALEPATAG